MAAVEKLITDNIANWALAVQNRAATGRGSSNKIDLYGIKKLRKLILELAVRGKLVLQNPEDEPASVLLERIAAEKAQLVKNKDIKKPRKLPDISEDDKPFEIPAGWAWARLQDIGRDWGQKKPDQKLTYIDVGAINKEFGYIHDPAVLEAGDAPSRARKLVKEGTVIYSTVRPYLLNIAVINQAFDPEPIASTAFAIIHPLCGMSGSFIYRYLRSPSFVEYVKGCQTGVAYPAINDKHFFSGLIPIPPEAEQPRIEAKVNELMSLCDQLEQQTETSLAAHTTLVENLLATLTSSTDAAELEQNWHRITEHFTTLFTTEESIDQLKQTVLQLAVMGKLVPQNPNDEPASVLLEKIAAEKAQLIKEKKIKKQKALPPIGEDEKSFELPDGWEWCRVWDVAHTITSGSRDWAKFYAESGAKFVTMGNLSRGEYELRLNSMRYVNPPKGGEGSRTKLEAGDLLISITGDVGNLGLIPEGFGEAYINQHTCMLRFMSNCRSLYFANLMRSPWAKFQFDAPQRGIKNSFRLGDVGEMIIPLPPEREWSRIVSKTEQLMSICDQLKTHLQQAQQTRLHLADAMVEQSLT